MQSIKGGAIVKVTITMDDDLLARVDAHAKKTYNTRSGYIAQTCARDLAQMELLRSINDIAISIRKVADTGDMDAETKKKLDDFETLVRLFTQD